ncbi:ChaN family lipoprotein [Roseovarius sp. S4756]|uniref:ChaN family lipoprotein n=1 Tax=Roseovarius maritimus TaxID=3342637 RepID=UPI003727D428
MRWAALLAIWAAPSFAQDIFVMGEVHDNPAHHAVQAERVAQLNPTALVFEMMTPGQAERITPDLRADRDALADALEWQDSGWPDFAYYFPIIEAAPGARIYGAGVPRAETRAVGEDGLEAAFGDGAGEFGLDQPLPGDQQAAREALQADAHCGALPEAILPMMVEIQRLRDAALARSALNALRETGGPVAVITGNGHARTDWGMPALLALPAPEVALHSLGQGEDGAPPEGTFDEVVDSPAPARADPCEAFR